MRDVHNCRKFSRTELRLIFKENELRVILSSTNTSHSSFQEKKTHDLNLIF